MINETSINVHIDVFEGPLDLLLHLIKKDNLDIYDINISDITKQYLEYLEIMKSLNLEVAGEFLVMASTLMQIKAKQLLPSQAPTTEEDGPNPTQDLINKIVEYQKFKEASKYLDGRFEEFKDNFYKSAPIFDSGERVLNLQMFDLLAAVKRAFDRLDEKQHVELLKMEEFPIEKKMDKIAELLSGRSWVLLDDIFTGETKKRGVITCFLALLELMKIRKIMARQDERNGEIRIYLNPENKDMDYKELFNKQENEDGQPNEQ
ncbi:Chromosome segregation and condensation protein ScpA [Elusimicrobium minutum Pei191]|uniref:Segregation and condensation protein A n=1 Tax=Elusimicrobium minutum (strain Pei191) TaxID=445932 RepID=B2KE27_ELUMP|nr:segregation/condensation protein A [Elusimicrobium minutum]ACC98773.1 Chromosome segregation and condensation protein ScpA [Elusimicrobium minutum Pei191]